VIFVWKFLICAAIQFFCVLWGVGGPPTLKCLCTCWKWVALAAVCTMGAALNTISNLETTSVSALLFFYVAPLWALCLGVLLLHEALQRRTVVAVIVAIAGVCLLFVPSVLGRGAKPARHNATHHAASFHGDMLGLLSGLAMAGYLTACRHASLFKPEAPMVLGVALGSLGAAAIGLCMALRGGHALLDVPYNMWPLLFADCMGIGLYGIMSALATRYLRGAEVAFLLLIDVIVAPLLVCVVYGEMPTPAGSWGAALLTAAVIGHEYAALRDLRSRNGAVAPEGALSPKFRDSDANLEGLDTPSEDDRLLAMADAQVEVEMADRADTVSERLVSGRLRAESS
jgi:drug/metabolite transporter (DMT)-like permease